ncbi:hypothetical protein THIOM_001183 [Candidatus Thiomargarita nelsonii]|uniref:Uncharacterized protein n=1 Tax=Candidatus Thiomargarita nelsonii TaxID=1003181 RepID=A0A176S4F1_9GAMM|nr:hypothetical protein THIOM_001183 [Candidatus Thiomargarita nelsonii]
MHLCAASFALIRHLFGTTLPQVPFATKTSNVTLPPVFGFLISYFPLHDRSIAAASSVKVVAINKPLMIAENLLRFMIASV